MPIIGNGEVGSCRDVTGQVEFGLKLVPRAGAVVKLTAGNCR